MEWYICVLLAVIAMIIVHLVSWVEMYCIVCQMQEQVTMQFLRSVKIKIGQCQLIFF